MRKFLRCFFVLLFASVALTLSGQNVSHLSQQQITYPYKSSPNNVQRLNANTGLNQGSAQSALVTCGPDTVFYPFAKATGFLLLNFLDSIALGQWYPAPQPITVSGASFFAYVDSATNATVDLIVRLYAAGVDSLPTGNPLATDTVTIDSNFFNGSLALLQKNANWAPVVVNTPYVVTVENNTSIECDIVINDLTATPPDGLQEWLGHIYLPGAPTAWYHGYQVNLGPNPFDADNIIMPHVTYDVTPSFTPTTVSTCTGLQVNWTNTSSPVLFSRFYNQLFQSPSDWNYGDGSPIDAVIDGQHTYTTAGNYNVTLLDTLFGWTVICVDSATGTANVATGSAPVANFNSTTNGLIANFNDLSSNTPNQWSWDFGDGNSSILQNPTHTYAMAGTYTVCLIASNACGSDTTCSQVTVIGGSCNNPVAGYTNTINNLTANFTDGSTSQTGISTWLWDFGDGTTSPQQNPSHTYSMPGTYTVCLTVTDSCGTDSTCTPLTVTCPALIASFTDTVIGLTIGVNSTTTGNPVTYLYDFGDGATSTLPADTHTYAMAGVYTVCLTVTDSCSSDSTCMTVVIGCPIPQSGFSFVTNGLTTNFTDQSTNLPTNWFWDFGDGNTSTQQNPSHTYATADTFLVCLIASSTCGADTTCDTIISGCNTPMAAFTNTPTNLQVAFTDASTGNPTSWFWDFGDGNTSTNQSPTHNYQNPGTYIVCLTATSACGSTTDCDTITVSCPAPGAAFTNTIAGLNVTFSDQSTGSPTQWFWDFGDGNTSTQQNPTHSYAMTGSYQVCLTVTSVCGQAQTCMVVNLSCPTPNSNFSFSNVNLSYAFNDLTTGSPTAWFWDFGDGNTSSQQNPTHVYANTGTYLVCLVTLNSCGTDSFCQPITVTCPTPAAGFTSIINQLQVGFTDGTAGNPTSWQWDFGDGGTSIQQNPSYTYAMPGTYFVCLTAVNSCGSDQFCDSVTVGCAAPVANFGFLTVGNNVDFTDMSGATTTNWFWDFGDGNTSTLQNPSHTFATTDTFNVCLIASSVCGSDTFCQDIIISCVPPTAGFSSQVSNDSVVSFTNMSSPNSVSFVWDFGDGTGSTAANPTHIYGAPGTYTVCLETINSCGRDTICNDVVITCVNPTAGYTVSVTNSVATFTDVSINAVSYLWDFGDGNTSTMANPVHSYTQSGIYTVCLTVTNFCGTNTTCQNLVIACNAPVVNFNHQNGVGVVNFTDLSANNPTTWFWDFGDGGTDTVQNPSHGYLFTGQFLVCLTATNACGSSDTCITINVTTVDMEDEDLLNQSLEIFPNPSSGIFTIKAEIPRVMDLSLQVTNMLGQELFGLAEGKRLGQYQREIDLSRLAVGTYILRIKAGDHVLHRKLVIE